MLMRERKKDIANKNYRILIKKFKLVKVQLADMRKAMWENTVAVL